MTEALSRRSVLTGFGTVLVGGLAGYVVARSSGAANGKPANATANGYGPAPQSSNNPSGNGTPLTSVSTVPTGGGVVITSQAVVVTKDSGGTVHAFSAVCTHQGCLVNQVADGTIDCPCHGSKFNADTGAVVTGPASSPLPKVAVTVKGGHVYRT